MGVWEYGSMEVWMCSNLFHTPILPYSHTCPKTPHYTQNRKQPDDNRVNIYSEVHHTSH